MRDRAAQPGRIGMSRVEMAVSSSRFPKVLAPSWTRVLATAVSILTASRCRMLPATSPEITGTGGWAPEAEPCVFAPATVRSPSGESASGESHRFVIRRILDAGFDKGVVTFPAFAAPAAMLDAFGRSLNL